MGAGHEGILVNERLMNWLRRMQTLHLLDLSPYLAYHTAWSSKQSRDWMERKHIRVLEVWQRLQALQGPQKGRATKLLNRSRQQLSVVIGLLIGHLGLNGHLYKIGKDINLLRRRCLNGNEIVEHLLCECESLTMSRGRIFGQSFGYIIIYIKLERT